jgi:uncharacterized protein (TIGR03437 family)
MKTNLTSRLCWLFLICAVSLHAAPLVRSIVNAASNINPVQPNGGVAEGAIFVVYGTGLGPGDIAISDQPFKTASVGGVSISVTVGGRTVDAPMYYASATQVAGLLPSVTPVGSGTLTVTYNGQNSQAARINVVQNNFGTFAVNQAGSGPAIVTYPDYSLVSATKAANPGDAVILWGTGLGPVSGDETGGPLPGDMTTVPVQVWLGVIPATVIYRGRSGCCIGEDQIVFTVPAGISACDVPLVVQIGNQVSNFTTMAIAESGRACTPAISTLPPDVLERLQNLVGVSVGDLDLKRTIGVSLRNGQPITQRRDRGSAVFIKYPDTRGALLVPGYVKIQPDNTCILGNSNPSGPALPRPVPLDAGATLTVNGLSGTRSITRRGAGMIFDYKTEEFGDTTPGNYFDPGHYTVTGPGGRDIDAFTAGSDFPQQQFQWTNMPNPGPLDRSKDLKITWTGGTPGTLVSIAGTSLGVGGVVGSFLCSAPIGPGEFTIPSYVFLSMPPTNPQLVSGGIGVENAVPGPFTARGIDVPTIRSTTGYSVDILFQ